MTKHEIFYRYPAAFVMVGLPGSGKSTWITENLDDSFCHISSDKLIESKALEEGKDYGEVSRNILEVLQPK